MESYNKCVFLVSGMLLFSLQDILVKLFCDNVNLLEVLFDRSILINTNHIDFLIIKKKVKCNQVLLLYKQ